MKNIKEKLVVSVFGYKIILMTQDDQDDDSAEGTCRIDSSDEENQHTDEGD